MNSKNVHQNEPDICLFPISHFVACENVVRQLSNSELPTLRGNSSSDSVQNESVRLGQWAAAHVQEGEL